MISFAQNLEDVMLARAFRGQEHGFYVDAGAWHPVLDSVTKHFYDLGWSGINVEPVEEYFAVLAQERPRDVNLRLALGERQETRTLHHFLSTGLSTLAGDHLEDLSSLGLERRDEEVEVATLREVCAAHVQGEIDFLKIDVEGWERQVILGADWVRFRPRIVLVEAVVPNPRAFLEAGVEPAPPDPAWDAWEGLVLAQGYQLCYFDGLNRFYVRDEDRHLRESFRFPPNVYDSYEPWPLALARAERNQARAELEQAEAELARLREEVRRLRQGT